MSDYAVHYFGPRPLSAYPRGQERTRLGVWFGINPPLRWIPVTMTAALRKQARELCGTDKTGGWSMAMPLGYTQWKYFRVGRTIFPMVGAWPYHFLYFAWGPSPKFPRKRHKRMAGK